MTRMHQRTTGSELTRMHQHVPVEGTLGAEDLAADGAGVGLLGLRGVVGADVHGEVMVGSQLLVAYRTLPARLAIIARHGHNLQTYGCLNTSVN